MQGGEVRKRRCCSCAKDDFLPEESFKSWSNYVNALKQTPTRFMDRLTARSLDETELHEVKDRSNYEMKKNLTWWDLMWFGIGAVIGAGIFVLTGQEAKEAAGPAVVLSYVVSGVSAMLSVFCYTEFAVEIPVAGEVRKRLRDIYARVNGVNVCTKKWSERTYVDGVEQYAIRVHPQRFPTTSEQVLV